MPDGVVKKGSRAAGKVLRTGKEPVARAKLELWEQRAQRKT